MFVTFPRLSPPRVRVRPAGFSLVEVVLAVGIISFCLVALMGLLAVSMNASRDSAAATADGLLFQKVINQLRVASTERLEPQTGGSGEEDRFPLPPAGRVGTKTFIVDEFNRFLTEGASSTDPEAARVVTVHVMSPVLFEQENAIQPADLDPGDLAVVSVSIRPARGPESTSTANASVFSTELNLAVQ